MEIWDGKCVDPNDVCCVCGFVRGRMTRHHVVPGCYRKPLHHDRNYHDLHDIVAICVPCHGKYEKHAMILKKRLCERYGVPMDGIGLVLPHDSTAIRAAVALVRHGDRIPAKRTAELRADIVSHLGREPEEVDMSELAGKKAGVSPGPDYVTCGELVAAKIENMQAFWRMWRTHFVEKMKPGFLPADWDLDREVQWEPDRCRHRKGVGCPCGGR